MDEEYNDYATSDDEYSKKSDSPAGLDTSHDLMNGEMGSYDESSNSDDEFSNSTYYHSKPLNHEEIKKHLKGNLTFGLPSKDRNQSVPLESDRRSVHGDILTHHIARPKIDYITKEIEASPTLKDQKDDIKCAYRLVRDLMAPSLHNINSPFMSETQNHFKNKVELLEIAPNPMWLIKIKEDIINNEYKSIVEIVRDLRVMLQNAYILYGPSQPTTKKALHLEFNLEQKLTALPDEMKEACTLDKTNGITLKEEEIIQTKSSRICVKGEVYFSRLLYSVKGCKAARDKEIKLKRIEAKKKAQRDREMVFVRWEQNVFDESLCSQINAMWELAQIGQFLALSISALNIYEVAQYEIERMLFAPQYSIVLRMLMTSLLSTPAQRVKIEQKPYMPYKIWANKLAIKVQYWYKIYKREKWSPTKVSEQLGIDPQFWLVCGQEWPFKHALFHELEFYKRVWLLKTLCDSVAHNHKSVQEAIMEQPEDNMRERILGRDRDDNEYIYLPQFINFNIRIYMRLYLYQEEDTICDTDTAMVDQKKSPRKSFSKEQIKYYKTVLRNSKRKFQVEDVWEYKSTKKTKRVRPATPVPSTPRTRPGNLRQRPTTRVLNDPVPTFSGTSDEDEEPTLSRRSVSQTNNSAKQQSSSKLVSSQKGKRKVFACTVCSKSFTFVAALNGHMSVHSKKKKATEKESGESSEVNSNRNELEEDNLENGPKDETLLENEDKVEKSLKSDSSRQSHEDECAEKSLKDVNLTEQTQNAIINSQDEKTVDMDTDYIVENHNETVEDARHGEILENNETGEEGQQDDISENLTQHEKPIYEQKDAENPATGSSDDQLNSISTTAIVKEMEKDCSNSETSYREVSDTKDQLNDVKRDIKEEMESVCKNRSPLEGESPWVNEMKPNIAELTLKNETVKNELSAGIKCEEAGKRESSEPSECDSASRDNEDKETDLIDAERHNDSATERTDGGKTLVADEEESKTVDIVWKFCNPKAFQLVVATVEDLRTLIKKFGPVPTKLSKEPKENQDVTKSGDEEIEDEAAEDSNEEANYPRNDLPDCESSLCDKLCELLADYSPYEFKLKTLQRQTVKKIYKEQTEFKNRYETYGDPDEEAWKSEPEPEAELPETPKVSSSSSSGVDEYYDDGARKRKLRKRKARPTLSFSQTTSCEHTPVPSPTTENDQETTTVSSRGRLRKVRKIVNYDKLDFEQLAEEAKNEASMERERKKKKKDISEEEAKPVDVFKLPSSGIQRYLLTKSGDVVGYIDKEGRTHHCNKDDRKRSGESFRLVSKIVPSMTNDQGQKPPSITSDPKKIPSFSVSARNEEGKQVMVKIAGAHATNFLTKVENERRSSSRIISIVHNNNKYSFPLNTKFYTQNIPGYDDCEVPQTPPRNEIISKLQNSSQRQPTPSPEKSFSNERSLPVATPNLTQSFNSSSIQRSSSSLSQASSCKRILLKTAKGPVQLNVQSSLTPRLAQANTTKVTLPNTGVAAVSNLTNTSQPPKLASAIKIYKSPLPASILGTASTSNAGQYVLMNTPTNAVQGAQTQPTNNFIQINNTNNQFIQFQQPNVIQYSQPTAQSLVLSPSVTPTISQPTFVPVATAAIAQPNAFIPTSPVYNQVIMQSPIQIPPQPVIIPQAVQQVAPLPSTSQDPAGSDAKGYSKVFFMQTSEGRKVCLQTTGGKYIILTNEQIEVLVNRGAIKD